MRKYTGNGSVKLLIVGIFVSIFLVLVLTFGNGQVHLRKIIDWRTYEYGK